MVSTRWMPIYPFAYMRLAAGAYLGLWDSVLGVHHIMVESPEFLGFLILAVPRPVGGRWRRRGYLQTT